MEPGDLIAIIFGCVTIAALVVSILNYRRMSPKRAVEYRINVVPLIRRTQALSNRITVLFDGEDVPNPHVVYVQIRATGRVDIRRDDFDGKQPLLFRVGRKTRPLEGSANAERFSLDGDNLIFHPTLIARNSEGFRTSFLTEGKPDICLVDPHPLADTTVKDGMSGSPEHAYVVLARWLMGLFFFAMGVLVVWAFL